MRITETGKNWPGSKLLLFIEWMKAGGAYRIYPTILSQIRNPPVLIRNSTLESLPRHREFLPAGFIAVIWRAWAKFSRRDFRTRKFRNFVRGKSRIFTRNGVRSSDRRVQCRKADHLATVPGFCSASSFPVSFIQTSEEWRRAGGSYRIYRAIVFHLILFHVVFYVAFHFVLCT
jgi:hypothetical protein